MSNLATSPHLLRREYKFTTPNTVWLADITYADNDEGWPYLPTVKGVATPEIIGWSIEDHLRTDLCSDSLRMALDRRNPVA
ncbi:hypothetical protein [Palleronia caenipelagi]|uniref:Integrase catalytic domain-containing protein n=1 Tax=Palleronia caenipelagi TaxID=2489174 RepID=A0A547PMF4_9RHOB|nr:hypothetical protein [Palleronia caenipelagi]TRD15325.1 hypothetical protein FEV53_16930 [Palleronia caenipelagi]